MNRRSITPADLYQFQWVADPQLSPDGRHVAFVIKTIDHETNAYRSSIWMTAVHSTVDDAYQFTSDGTSPRWSPDGNSLAFVSARDGIVPEPKDGESPGDRDKRIGKGKPQIWLIPFAGGEALQQTRMPWGVASVCWSPDGRRLLFTAQTGDIPEMPEHDGKTEPRAHRITEFMYRYNGHGYINELRTHVFLLPVAGGDPLQLTDGDWDDGNAQWSPDGQRIVFTSDRRADRWRMPQSQIWVMDADGGNQYAVTAETSAHEYYNPSWSPDGTRIACLGGPIFHNGGHSDVFVFRPGEEPRCLTEHHFVTFSDSIGSDMRNDHADDTPIWGIDNDTVYVLGNARGAGNVYALKVSDQTLTLVTEGNHQILGYSFDTTFEYVALAIADSYQPGDIFAIHRAINETIRLTDVNGTLLSEVYTAEPEHIEFKGSHGWDIEGWLLKPQDFDPTKRYPLLLEIHGGPNTCYGYSYVHEFQSLVGQGYCVLYTNPRGSTSYGREFSKAVHGRWGLEDYEDLMAGVEHVVARGYIDDARLGVLGGSYGGYMTNWIIGHTNRFQAAITQRCVSNLISKFGTSDIGPWMALDNWDGAPWETMERYIFHSPITYVHNMHTPLLIIHSEEDWRCPIEQAEQMFTSLTWLRQKVEFLKFEGANHDLTRNGHPRLRVENQEAIIDWFKRYL